MAGASSRDRGVSRLPVHGSRTRSWTRSSHRASRSMARLRFCVARRLRSCSTGSCSSSRSITSVTPARRLRAQRRGCCAATQSRTSPRRARWRAPPARTRAQIAGLTLAAVASVDASLASGHRIAPPFQPLLDAQRLAGDAAGADGDEPLFLAPDGTQPVSVRHIQSWLARIGRETGLRFETTSGWNRYTAPAWASFHPLAIPALIAR